MMEKLATMVASSRGFPLPLSRWATLCVAAAFAIFILCGTWYSRSSTSLDTYTSRYHTPAATVDAHTEDKELLVDHRPVPVASSHDTVPTGETWDDCLHLPGAENILVLLKTGATAIYDRLPMHFESTFKCIPHYMIISDLEQTIGDVPVYDVLELVTQTTKENRSSFHLYNDIAFYHASGQDPSKLAGPDAWDLDKWKFLPMIHKAWSHSQTELHNTIDWFVMIEADTSLSWLNLIHFLRDKDPSQPHFIGSPAMLVADGSTFNHGGSGIIMSRTAIEKVETKRKNFTPEFEDSGETSIQAYDKYWEDHTDQVCCGDAVLAHAFADVGVHVTSARPMIQGESPLTIPWELPQPGNADSELWCKTPITWHHVKENQVDELYQFQQNWVEKVNGGSWKQTYLYKDIFEEMIYPNIENLGRDDREEWDNHAQWIKIEIDPKTRGIGVAGPNIPQLSSEDQATLDQITGAAVDSAENCRLACERRGAPHPWKVPDECVQWKWATGKCYLDFKIRLGEIMEHSKLGDGQDKWMSGWLKERVEKWKVKQGNCGR